LAGAIAIIQRGDCYIDQKINFAQQAGAIAVIVYQQSGDDIQSSQLPASTTGIPAALVGNTDGNALRAAGGNATLDPAFTPSEDTGNVVWPASSRGPSPGDFGNTKTNVIKPEITAVGANIYTAAQRLDPSGEAYNATGYTSVSGTSYATAIVAGAAALVKQKNPRFTPAQIKSAVVNTASQDVTDGGSQASVRSVGAGRLNIGDAVNATFTASPATISFGAIASAAALPIGRTLTIANGGASPVSLTLAVAARTADANARVQLGASALNVAAGSTGNVTVTLTGTRPNPGSYEGFIEIRAGTQTLRVPYLYMVSDNVLADVYAIGNGFFVGGVSDVEWELDLRVVDQYGVPLESVPVRFAPISGGGKINESFGADDRTFRLGNAAAFVDLGPNPGENIFRGTVGGPAGPFVDFTGLARHYPHISDSGVVNAATNQPGIAAGSYISIYGSDFAEATQVESTPHLPVALSSVAVSVDADGVSLPAKLHFISPGQVNAQIPWEFAGKQSVKVKIWSDYFASNVMTVPLAQYAPGIFEVSGLAAAQNGATYALITRQAPAKRGDTIILYVNGLGPVTNTPASGEPTGSTTFSTTTVPPSVTIGGRPAQPIFSGLTPGVVGLYQINLTIAADTPTGDQPIVVTIGGVSSKASVLPVGN
jgi:uncharacterized protein (TIGR03437 family)